MTPLDKIFPATMLEAEKRQAVRRWSRRAARIQASKIPQPIKRLTLGLLLGWG